MDHDETPAGTLTIDPDDELLNRARRRYRRVLVVLSAFMLLPVLIVFGFSVRGVIDGKSWWLLLVPVIMLLALAAPIGVMYWQRHRFPGPIRLGGADWATRRRVGRAVQRGELPAEEPDRSLGLELARSLDKTRWTIWSTPIVLLTFVFNAFLADELWSRMLIVGGIVLIGIGWLINLRRLNRVRRILREVDAG